MTAAPSAIPAQTSDPTCRPSRNARLTASWTSVMRPAGSCPMSRCGGHRLFHRGAHVGGGARPAPNRCGQMANVSTVHLERNGFCRRMASCTPIGDARLPALPRSGPDTICKSPASPARGDHPKARATSVPAGVVSDSAAVVGSPVDPTCSSGAITAGSTRITA
jgi:hypothetical protein